MESMAIDVNGWSVNRLYVEAEIIRLCFMVSDVGWPFYADR